MPACANFFLRLQESFERSDTTRNTDVGQFLEPERNLLEEDARFAFSASAGEDLVWVSQWAQSYLAKNSQGDTDLSLFGKQEMDMKPSENVWAAITEDLAPADNLEYVEGKENKGSELNEDAGSGGVDPQRMADADESQLPDGRHEDMLIGVKNEPDTENHSGSQLASGKKSSLEVRAQLFSDSTDEDGDSGDEENEIDRQDAVSGKRSRSPEGVAQSLGKKFKGHGEGNHSVLSASTREDAEGYNPHAVKVEDQTYRAELSESYGTALFIPPGLERLHRIFTSLNTACGFLQNQQLESSWPNVKRALQQLSGTHEAVPVEDVLRLAQLCPRMVVVSNFSGEGEDANFYIELIDPSEPTNSEQQQNGPSENIQGRRVSDTEARVIVENRQKAFQFSLTQLAQQLQLPQGCADASEHGSHPPIHAGMQRHPANDGHFRTGPAILALPTQTMVLTPPPLLPQQLQQSFIGISNGYHGMPFPIQVQPTNAYAFTFPQQQANSYAGYQLSSIPSASQPSSIPANDGSQTAQPTTPIVIDLTELTGTPNPSSFNDTQSLNKAQPQGKRRRSRNWDPWEVMLLVQAKRNEWDLFHQASGQERLETSGERWKKVEAYLKENKVFDRDAAACKNKWESLLSDYKVVKDWNRKPGHAPYNSLTSGEKKAASLPGIFASSLLDLMDTFQGKSVHVSPPVVVDSLGRSAPDLSGDAASGGAASGGDGSDGEDSREEPALAPHNADAVQESLAQRSGSHGGHSPLVAAIDRLTANMMNIEKGTDERFDRLIALQNRKYELERNKFELQARKLEIEREDRKGLMRVLGNLAGAFHRMADKM